MGILYIDAAEFEVKSGEAEYALELPSGDCQLDYRVFADGDVALYLSAGAKVVPLDVGTRLTGRVMVRDAKWLLVKPAKKSTQVAISVHHAARRLTEYNSGKPVAVFVPEPPKVDLKTMVSRILAERGEAPPDIEFGPEDLADLMPDDVDTEFGTGFTQLEDDEDIADALRKREEDHEARKRGARERPGGRREAEAGVRGDSDRSEPPEPATPPAEEPEPPAVKPKKVDRRRSQ